METTRKNDESRKKEIRVRECLIIPGTDILVITGLKCKSDKHHSASVSDVTRNHV